MAQLDEVLDVRYHVLPSSRVDLRDQTVLLYEVARNHVPQPPKLLCHDLDLRKVVRRAQSLELVLEFFDLFEEFVHVATGLTPPLDTRPFVTVRHVAEDVDDVLADLGELSLKNLVRVHALALPLLRVRVRPHVLARRRREEHFQTLPDEQLLETLIELSLRLEEVQHVRDLLHVWRQQALDRFFDCLVCSSGRVRDRALKDLALRGAAVRRRHRRVQDLLDQLQLVKCNRLLQEELNLVDVAALLSGPAEQAVGLLLNGCKSASLGIRAKSLLQVLHVHLLAVALRSMASSCILISALDPSLPVDDELLDLLVPGLEMHKPAYS